MSSKTAGIPRYRPFDGPALLRQGFRPFFLGAGLWALAAIPLWILQVQGSVSIPTAFDPVGWHAHEMLFGFILAAISGFLLTAIPNWTGRMPLQGVPLAVLVGVWIVGRLAVGASAWIADLHPKTGQPRPVYRNRCADARKCHPVAAAADLLSGYTAA